MNTELRVIHVITRLIIGGAQENTVSSVLGLRLKPNLSVQLISGDASVPASGPGQPATLTHGSEGSLESKFTNLPGVLSTIPELVRPIHPWNDLRALRRLTHLFRERRPHLVHTHSGKAGVVGRFAARRARVPVIVHTIHG